MNRKQIREMLTLRDVLTDCRDLQEIGRKRGEIDDFLFFLAKQERRLHRLAESNCNGEIEQADYERRSRTIEKHITAYCESMGLRVRYNGDPRGGAIRLLIPGRHNSWDGETWVIDFAYTW